jgi:2,3-bisphosphoglycerate-independent phosphoglycerate mutase
MKKDKKVALVILDGWGHGRKDESNAVFKAQTPFTDSLYVKYAHAELRTDGENVGLPDGQMGNSEVGHTNIGAGRVVYQDLVKINIAARERTLHTHPKVREAIEYARTTGCKVHLMGLVSDGGVHSHISHLKALCEITSEAQLKEVYIHAFTDGRDTDPQGGAEYIKDLEQFIEHRGVKIASVIGRYYAMDRDKRWERVKKAYDLLVKGEGEKFTSASEAITQSYAKEVTDEFIEPSVMVDENGAPLTTIAPGDVVICFNFRTDRCREITEVLTQKVFPEYAMEPLSLYYVTMTRYDDTFENVHVIYEKDNLIMTLGEVLERHGKSQVRIAETEKYPHVTFFFSGGREKEFVGEKRIMIPSPKVATYDLQPEMSAQGIADAIIQEMDHNAPDFICLNFANPDMVGHTGVFEAIMKAVETTDDCLHQVVKAGLRNGYSFVIIADHGNADYAINEDGSPNTAHTTNPVPVWILDRDVQEMRSGILADVAPTVLKLMNIPAPEEFTGQALI